MAEGTGEGFDLRVYLQTLRRRRTSIILVTVGVVLTALVVSLLQSRVYRASAEILLQPRDTESVFNPGNTPRDTATGTVETEIRVLRSDAIRDAVRAAIGRAPKVTATRVGETEVMRVSALDGDAEQAARTANAYATAYLDFRKSQAVGNLVAAMAEIQARIEALQAEIDVLDRRLSQASPADRPSLDLTLAPRYTNLLAEQSLLSQKRDSLQVDAALKSGGAQLVRGAAVPTSPASPKPVRNAVAALLVGLVVGTGLAFLREHLDDSIRTKAELARIVPGVPVLGIVPAIEEWDKGGSGRHLQNLRMGSTPATEAYRSLRTSVQLLGVERPMRTLQVTSPGPAEGKTTLIANLAVVLAAAGQRVVMVDCDLRRPTLHQRFGLANDVGFTSVFLGEASPLSTVQPVDLDPSLFVVPSGPLPANPSELLSSNRTARFIFELQSEFDVVLVDSPPVLPVTDAIVLAAWVEGTLLVTRSGSTTGRQLADAVERLRQVDARLVGTVLNYATGEATYGYSYGYGTTGSRSRDRRR